MKAAPDILQAADLLDLSRSGHAAALYSPLSDQQVLTFAGAADGLSAEEQKQVCAWLRNRPCPLVAVGAGPLAAAADVTVENTEALTPLLNNIRSHPMAAAALCQLLRISEGMSGADALSLESLTYTMLQSGPEFRRWLESERKPMPAPPAEPGPAVLMEREGEVLRLELNRPGNHNAMSVEMRDALVEALQLVLSDDTIRTVQLSGRGKCFSTGGDLTEFGTLPDPATAHFVRALAVPGRYLAQCAQRVEVHVHGACIGSGIEFPAFAGRITASEDTHFQLPELRFGLIPGAGGCISIARRIGRQRTAWLALSGKRVNARTALQWGLVDELR